MSENNDMGVSRITTRSKTGMSSVLPPQALAKLSKAEQFAAKEKVWFAEADKKDNLSQLPSGNETYVAKSQSQNLLSDSPPYRPEGKTMTTCNTGIPSKAPRRPRYEAGRFPERSAREASSPSQDAALGLATREQLATTTLKAAPAAIRDSSRRLSPK